MLSLPEIFDLNVFVGFWKLQWLRLIGNRTSCCPILSVIILMINKLDSCLAVVNFVNHSHDCRPNWTPLGPITIIYLLGVLIDDEMCSWGQNLGSGVL